MGGALAILMLLVPVGGDAPEMNCPANHAVEVEIGRLGGARALAVTGTTDITVEDASMRIVLRAHDGRLLGMREVAAPGVCQERAVVAAVVIVAWLGQWSGGEPGAAPLPTGPSPPAIALAAPPRALTRAAPSTRRGDIAAFGSGVHDGDVGTWGLGVQAGYAVGQHLSVTVLGERMGERMRPLGPGQAAYWTLRIGAGVALRRMMGRVFLDGAVAPEAVRFSLHGEGLASGRGATVWGLALDGRVRLGLRVSQVVLFVYGDTDYALTTARLTLDDRPDSVTLSRWSFAAGSGLLFSFGPLGG